MFGAPKFDAPHDLAEQAGRDSENTNATEKSTTVSSRRQANSAPTPARRAGRSLTAVIAAGFIVSLLAGFAGGFLGAKAQDNGGTVTNASITQQKKIATDQGQLIASIAKNVGPSVVSVDVVTQAAPTTDVFGFTGNGGTQEAAGTGIIISSQGVIITNRHVVPAGTTNVSVTLSDGTKFDNVSVIGRTSSSDSLDIAFLKINDLKGHTLTPAAIGDSGNVQVGDTVVAIGNALGQFNNTVTSGIISGYGRSVTASQDGSSTASAENLDDLFQTDAAINEGNSGGPLVNVDGKVIGINTAIAGNGQNIGFAIPINDVSGLIKQVLSTGKFERPYLGVRYVALTPDVAKQYNVSAQSGAYVLPAIDPSQPSVISGGPADKAGVKEGDIITAVDGTQVDQRHSLTSLVGQHSIGDSIDLTVLRSGKMLHLSATLQAMPQDNSTDQSTGQ